MPSIQNSKSTLAFLDELGSSDKGDQVVLSATARALVELGEFLITTASDNMDRSGNVDTGGTISSMRIVNLDLRSVKMSLEIEVASNYKFLDQGVKGTEGGTGKFQFRNNGVGRKMHAAISSWLRRRGTRGSGYPKKYGAYGTKLKSGGKGKVEKKDRKVNPNSAEALSAMAYAVGTSIKKKGIRPTGFFSKAVAATEQKQKEVLADALRIDIINSLNIN